MTTYNTGNALGSTEVEDLYDNTQNLDVFSNSQEGTAADRFGVYRKTLAGIRNDANTALLTVGFEFIGDYVTNSPLTITRPNQTFSRSGEYYRAGPSLVLPYTTVANWTIDGPKFVSVGDAQLRSDLANTAPGFGVELVAGAARADRTSQIVNTVADMLAMSLPLTAPVFTLGYYAAGDGGGAGPFYWDPAGTEPANGGTVFGTGTGRIKRAHGGTLDPRTFGAKGDGVTDDRAAIQAAIDVFATVGGEVKLSDGVFGVGGTGLILRDEVADFNGQILSGTGKGTVLKKLATANAILQLNAGGCTVRDITFDGAMLASNAIYIDKAFDGRTNLIENCSITQIATLGQGIYNFEGDACFVRNCYFLNAGQWAVESRNNMMNSSFTANYIQGSGGFHFMSATQQAEGVRITDNTMLISGGSGYGIDVEFGLDFTIANNIIDQTTLGCVRIRNNASYVKLTNNWFAGTCSSGHVVMYDNANRVTLIGNTFEGGVNSQFIANSAGAGFLNSITSIGNQHGNINATAAGQLYINCKRVSVTGNVMAGPGGLYSIYWNTGTVGILANNVLWKAIQNDGTATSDNNLIG